ncbi:hypothetical protein MBELCI_2479 [Limimaricola cinnabarinus LL-001]|uniref:Uncharacterized protein n=1 Tax=Limimaricola cinnabarinus LL-001 TaxID=1337093 RepID=U2Z5U9_9RHOB|nr:hypothetical protein MBELCI_2479 [Limimaricola cinnabarinus LL-001]
MRAKPLQQTGCVRAPSEQSRLVVEERLFDYDAAILPEAAQGRSISDGAGGALWRG